MTKNEMQIKRYNHKIPTDKINTVVLFAMLDGEVVGYLSIDRSNKLTNWAKGLSVRKKYRRAGVATKLLDRAIEITKDGGKESLGFWVNGKNDKCISLCKKLGFFVSYHNNGGYGMVKKTGGE